MQKRAGENEEINDCEVIAWMKMGGKCQICQGYAHEWYECPTKRKLDYRARRHEAWKNAWGQWKYNKYWKHLN